MLRVHSGELNISKNLNAPSAILLIDHSSNLAHEKVDARVNLKIF